MELPVNITNLIDEITSKVSTKELLLSESGLSKRYMDKTKEGASFFNSDIDVISYLNFRFPATYSSVADIINLNKSYLSGIKTVLDVGAGCGTASLAIDNVLTDDLTFECLENNDKMISTGELFFKSSFIKGNYNKNDITKKVFTEHFDLVVASYFMNELSENEVLSIAKKLWDSTDKYLLLIEPGTPNGYGLLMKIRSLLLTEQAYIVSPCPHIEKCPLCDNDWCHFITRVSRTKIHKLLKNGDSPYEDEKYSYILFSKEEIKKDLSLRVIRHPMIYKGYVELEGCSSSGEYKKVKYSKKLGDIYKRAKKIKTGETI